MSAYAELKVADESAPGFPLLAAAREKSSLQDSVPSDAPVTTFVQTETL